MSDQDDHYEHLEEMELLEMELLEMELLEMSIDELREENARLKRQLEKCKEQRRNATTCYYEQIYGQTKQGLIEIGRDELAEDAEIEEIK